MEARSQFAVKLLPSLTDFAFLMPIAFLFGRMDGVKTLLSDCDTGWHIRTGEWILANGWVPMRDIFSFSKPGEPWFAWEWLSDIVLRLAERAGRTAGRGDVHASCCSRSPSPACSCWCGASRIRSWRSLVTMLAAAASSIHWLARPHLFTLLFLVLFYAALERVREGRTHIAGIPFLAMLPVITDSVDQSARRILRRRADDRGLRRRRDCCSLVFCAARRGPAARAAQGARLLPERGWRAWRPA